MLKLLAKMACRHMFLVQVVALLGTGLATVALDLRPWKGTKSFSEKKCPRV